MYGMMASADSWVITAVYRELSFLCAMQERLNIPRLLDGAVWQYRAGVVWPRHRHRELELNLVLGGEAKVLVERRRYALTTGTLLWLFPRQEHVVYDAVGLRMWIVVFRQRLLRRLAPLDGRAPLAEPNPRGEFCRRLALGAMHELDLGLRRLHGQSDDPVVFNLGLAYVARWAWLVFTAAASPTAVELHPAVQVASARLRDEDPTLTLSRLAADAGLSPARLSHLFKRQMGVGMAVFRNECRLQRFLMLRAETGSSQRKLLHLALKAGFGSYAQFHRVYRRHFGHAPVHHQPSGRAM